MKTLDLNELRDSGVLQEANRLFFHPIGLALAVRFDEITGTSSLFVWDAREDPEGIVFSREIIDHPAALQKAEDVLTMFRERELTRVQLLGGHTIQAIPGFNA